MQKFIEKLSPSPDGHCTKSGKPRTEPSKHLSSTARSPATNTYYIVIATPEPTMSPALLVRVPQKARPGLNFDPGRSAGPELCISSRYLCTYKY